MEKIILIDNVENLNLNSLNALLKIVEEPNDNTIFILIFDSNKSTLETLKSRCLKFNLSLSFGNVIDITSRILERDILTIFNDDFLYHYNTPGELVNLVNFATLNNLNLKEFNLKQFIIYLIDYYLIYKLSLW